MRKDCVRRYVEGLGDDWRRRVKKSDSGGGREGRKRGREKRDRGREGGREGGMRI